MSDAQAVKRSALIVRSGLLSALALGLSVAMLGAQTDAEDPAGDRTGAAAAAGKVLERLSDATRPERAYRALDALLDDPAWKSGALKLIELGRSSDTARLPSSAASRSSNALLPVAPAPMRILELESTGDVPPDWTCEIDATDGATVAHKALRRGVLRLGAWFDSDTINVAWSCHASNCLFGCDRSAKQRVRLSSLPARVDTGAMDLVLRLRTAPLDPDADSGGDASPNTPLVVEAASAVAGLSPHGDHVNYRLLDATDFVRVHPARSYTSALLCARLPLQGSVRATADASEDSIGAFVLGGRCLAASVDRWQTLQFQIVARTPQTVIDYEVIALSGGTRPDLGLVAWFVAKRLVTDASLTRAEEVRATRELLDAFGVNLETDGKTPEVVGDPTLLAFLQTLATIQRAAP